MANLTKANPILTGLSVLSVLLFAAVFWMSLVYAPTEQTMGEVQRIFYFHVATAWVGMLAFIAVLVTSILYLIRRNPAIDRLSVGMVELGLIFMIIATATGAVWGRPVWNTWWTWDPRLTTTTVMILLYAAYLLLRQAVEDPQRRATFAAVYGIFASVSVPLTFFSIRIWRTIHPVVIGTGDPEAMGSMNMTDPMRQTMIFAVVALTVVFITLLWHRLRLEKLREQADVLRQQALEAA